MPLSKNKGSAVRFCLWPRMKIFNLVNLFLINFLFNTVLFERLFLANSEAALASLQNLQNDFTNISFPINFKINIYFISVTLSLILSIIVSRYSFENKEGKIKNPVEILSTFLKLFSIYCSVLFGIMYLFRLYSLSRAYIIFAIILYPFLSSFTIYFRELSARKITSKNYLIPLSLFTVLLISSYLIIQTEDENVTVIDSIVTTTTTPFIEEDVPGICSPWLGSDNFNDCVVGAKVNNVLTFSSESLNNVVRFKQDLYILDPFGKIYKNSNEETFLDITSKVLNYFEIDYPSTFGTNGGEAGLFSIAFHPNNEYFIISYTNKDNNLVFEKYLLNSEQLPIISSAETIKKIPSANCCHYSGNIIWSDYFKDFLISIGEMNHSPLSYLSSEPLDTSSPRGKILFLNLNDSSPEKISSSEESLIRKDILVYGLRNPWKNIEHDGYLFVPDLGDTTQEELNVIKLSDYKDNENSPFLLGWPLFEGVNKTRMVFNNVLLWDKEGQASQILPFVNENTNFPIVYYDHDAPENYRAAIIGGDVIDDPLSKYFNHFVFADYVSQEIFAYDYINDRLLIFPLDNNFSSKYSYISSVANNPSKIDTIFVTTLNGSLIEIALP